MVRATAIVYVILYQAAAASAGATHRRAISRQREFSGVYINSERVINIAIFNQPAERNERA